MSNTIEYQYIIHIQRFIIHEGEMENGFVILKSVRFVITDFEKIVSV